MPERLPAASLIVCSRNRARMLVDTVHSILAGEERPAEIVIVDQSDTSSEAAAALEGRGAEVGCEVRYLAARERGVSRGRNLGVTAARHDVLVFTDDDVSAPSHWFGALVRALLEAGPGVVVTGRVLAAPPEVPGAFAPSTRQDEEARTYRGRVAVDVLYSANMAVHRSLLQQVGGFDERLGPGTRFPAAEDNDLCFRLLNEGHEIRYVPQATLYHRAWRHPREYLKQCWQYELGQGAFYAKHMSVKDRFMLGRMLGQLRRQTVRMVRSLPRSRRKTYVDAISICALVVGACGWTLAHRSIGARVPRTARPAGRAAR